MESNTITTQVGDIPISRLVHQYEMYVAAEKRKAIRRNEFNQTEKGREINCCRYKRYYEKNKERVKEKNKARYYAKKAEAEETEATESTA